MSEMTARQFRQARRSLCDDLIEAETHVQHVKLRGANLHDALSAARRVAEDHVVVVNDQVGPDHANAQGIRQYIAHIRDFRAESEMILGAAVRDLLNAKSVH